MSISYIFVRPGGGIESWGLEHIYIYIYVNKLSIQKPRQPRWGQTNVFVLLEIRVAEQVQLPSRGAGLYSTQPRMALPRYYTRFILLCATCIRCCLSYAYIYIYIFIYIYIISTAPAKEAWGAWPWGPPQSPWSPWGEGWEGGGTKCYLRQVLQISRKDEDETKTPKPRVDKYCIMFPFFNKQLNKSTVDTHILAVEFRKNTWNWQTTKNMYVYKNDSPDSKMVCQHLLNLYTNSARV